MIEQKLGWSDSSEWKQRDFLNLIHLLENKSGILLSLSTIKRIWKTDYKNLPHPSTLDALARFLDYENWLDFKNNNKQNTDVTGGSGVNDSGGSGSDSSDSRGSSSSIGNGSRGSSDSSGSRSGSSGSSIINLNSRNGGKRLLQSKPFRVIASISIILILPVIVLLLYQAINLKTTSPSPVIDPDDIEFYASTSVSEGVPNTVIFHFDVTNIDADSFLVQQSWNMFKRAKIDKSDNKLTSVYFYPGIHRAKIIANDNILKEVKVRINTVDWIAMARYDYSDDIPVYIRDKDIRVNGKMHVTADHLESSNVEINRNTIVSYYYTDDFAELDSGNFTLETRLRADSIFNYTCPHITICILGDGDVNYVHLTTKGCVGNTEIKIGDNLKSGFNNDLSSLGTDVYDWQYVRIIARNNIADIYLNNNHVFEMPFSEDIGDISGININFTGTGIIDFVRLYNRDNLLVYDTGLDSQSFQISSAH